jgi:hypothetical protein
MANKREFLVVSAIAGLSLVVPGVMHGEETKKPVLKGYEAREKVHALNAYVYKDAVAYNMNFAHEEPDKIFEEIWPAAKAILQRAYLILD